MTLIISDSDKFYEDNNGIKKKNLRLRKKKKLLKLGSQIACSKKGYLRLAQGGATPEI